LAFAGEAAKYSVYAGYSMASEDWSGGNVFDHIGNALGNAYDDMGGLTINVANLGAILDFAGSVVARSNKDNQSVFGDGSILQKLSDIGLLEVNFGRDGVSTAIGMGGIDVGGALYEQVKRGIDYAGLKSYAKREEDSRKADMAWRDYVYGDFTQENAAMRLVSGKDYLGFTDKDFGVDDEGRIKLGETVSGGRDGKGRTITITDIGDLDTMSVVLGHEAYRDGKTGADNKQETREAVIMHTLMAAKMRAEGVDFSGSFVGQDLAVYDYARAVGDMSLMDAYADAFYKSEQDYFDFDFNGFTFDPFGGFVNFLSQNDTGFKFANLLNNVAKGDSSSKAVLDDIAKKAGKEMARQGAEAGLVVADNVSTAANAVSIGATLTGEMPIAIGAGVIVTIADISGFGFSLLADNEEKRNKFASSVILNILFKGASKVIPNYPVWNNGAERFRSSTKGRFMKTRTGKIINLIPPVAGSTIPPLFEREF
jgi:hypothetical protein